MGNFQSPNQKYIYEHQGKFLDFIFPTTESFFPGKTILDAGCGMGRFFKTWS
jgi:2-polyprenyl-3-methyl-5-hydroxy-6-metoxy-1,4-benzoquinol methylase